ncbi:YggS family pyridoxal phosphate-dependent enzyme [Methylococcus sp. EFPC2]|uniref:YggS family pyridoxal phosphate-dependent enzyme n=1 Tax=Methylococcus sp. EFPC2 TaxID=2812648 RepID=UPI00196793E5|nr:YggS family pyridoxal phosphate-dependent enzyme [Methylococcus sp. EFPC2]QSA96152.1 YggS family pyridoxal phosphate-dependent enzyme [Methylococcus sp. EFPC2]
MTTTTTLESRLAAVRQRITDAETRAGRPAGSVRLIAVSKTHPAEAIAEAYRLGQRDFGENYLQEALDKQAALDEPGIVWHFIGPIQSNKTRPIAEHFDWVHSVDRLKVAERLDAQRPADKPPLNICLQVNVSGEASKSGVDFAELPALAQSISGLPHLRLRGLMTIPAPTVDPAAQHAAFRALRQAMEDLALDDLDTLSMGMSDDLEVAVAEGATLVRIGTAIFGARARPLG